MAKSDETQQEKKPVDPNKSYLVASVRAALSSDPEIKFCMRPAQFGIKSSPNTLVVQMATGEQYRVMIKVIDSKELEE